MAKVELDIKLNPKLDKSAYKKQITTLEADVSDIDIGIHIDSADAENAVAEVMDAYAELEEAMNDIIMVEIDTSEGEIALDRLNKAIREVEGANFDVDGLADEFSKTKKEVDDLANTQKRALAQMKLTGKEGTDSYKKLQGEIDETETKIREMEEAMGDLADVDEPEAFINFMAKFEALSRLGESLSDFAESGLEMQKAMREVQAATGSTNEEMIKLKENAIDAYKVGVGESVADAVKTVGYGKQVLGDFLDTAEIQKFIVSAQGIANVFDKDINDVIAGSRTFVAQFGLDGVESANLVALAMQNGASKMDDVLDTLDEYSQLVVKAGYSAEEMIGLMNMSMEKGLRDTDKLMDSIKEAQIRLNAGDTTRAITDISGPIARQIQGIVRLGEQGVKSINEVTHESAALLKKAYNSGEITAAVRDQLTTALGGTMAEDVGGEMWAEIFSADIDESAIRAQAARAGQLVNEAVGPITFVDKVQKELEAFAASAGEVFAGAAQAAGGMLQGFSKVAPGLTLIGSSIGPVKDLAKSLITKLAPGLVAAAKAQGGLNMAMLANPYVAIIAGVAALATGIYFLADALHESAREKLEDQNATKDLLKSQIEMNSGRRGVIQGNLDLVDSFREQGESAKSNQTLMLKLAKAYPKVLNGSETYRESLKLLEKAAKDSRKSLSDLDDEMIELTNKSFELDLSISKTNVHVAKENFEDELQDAFSGQGPTFMNDWIEKGIDTLFGSSESRWAAEKITKGYTDAIYQAKNDQELQKASIDLQMAIQGETGGFEGLTPKEKQNLIAKARAIAAEQKKAIELENRSLETDLSNMIDQGRTQNDIVSFLSKHYGKSKDEIVAMIEKQKKSKKETDKQVDAVGDLATAWNAAKASASKALGEQISELSELRNKGKERNEDEEERYRILVKTAKETVKDIDRMNAIEKKTRKMIGLDKEAGRSSVESTKDVIDAKLDALEAVKEMADIEREIAIIRRGSEETIYDEIIAQEAAIKLLNDKLEVLGESAKLTSEQRAAIHKQIEEINFEIKKEEKNLEKLTITAEIDMADLDKELEAAKREYQQKKIEFDISLGLADESALFPVYQQQLQALADEKERINNKMDEADEETKRNMLIRLEEIKGEELDIDAAHYDAKMSLVERHYDKEQDMLDRRQAKLQEYNDLERAMYEDILQSVEDASLESIDLLANGRLDALDKQQERELDLFAGTENQKKALLEKHTRERERIEKEAAKQQLSTQAAAAGARYAIKLEENRKVMELEREQLMMAMERAEGVGDTDAYNKAAKALDALDKKIKDSSDNILQSSKLMGEGVGTIIGNLFTGNDEAMYQGMRDTLSALVGFIRQLITTWVLELVLESPWFKAMASAAGPAAPLVTAGSIGLMTAAINAIVSPLLNGIAAWPTGGIFDQPTMAIIGDGAKLGGENREILLRDDQLQKVLEMVVEKNNAVMASYFGSLLDAISKQRIVGKLVGSDMLLLMGRAQEEEDRRTIG